MKYILLNLKRFDIPPERGGVNSLAPVDQWASIIIQQTKKGMEEYDADKVAFAMFFPEAHLLEAVASLGESEGVHIGCQGVYREDTQVGGNFGAFTTNLTANAAAAMGCGYALIGHSEERRDKAGILAQAGVTNTKAVGQILSQEVLAAQKAGLTVVFCIGEQQEEQQNWHQVLGEQLKVGLQGADPSKTMIAYEPIWSIGPGKHPADKEYITKVARFVKEQTKGLPVVYGGGLKSENAQMLASIPEVDGGLIALTQFTGIIGFYPEQYLEIVKLYMEAE